MTIKADFRAKNPSKKIFGGMSLKKVIVFAISKEPTMVNVDEKPATFKYIADKQKLEIEAAIKLADEDHKISWDKCD